MICIGSLHRLRRGCKRNARMIINRLKLIKVDSKFVRSHAILKLEMTIQRLPFSGEAQNTQQENGVTFQKFDWGC